jgi:hypothetical protein
MKFLELIPYLKQTKKATRPGLGGYLVLANGISQSIPISNESEIQSETHFIIIFDELEMIEPFVPWLEDIEADDWTIVE